MWDGMHAWNASGQPIDRAGNVIANNNTSGTGTGSASYEEILSGQAGADALWILYQQEECTTSTVLKINGVVDTVFYGYVPC